MIVQFSASTRNINEDIEIYRLIVNTVRKLGHSIARDWIETAWLMQQGAGPDGKGWDMRSIVLEVEAGIDIAEVAIVEATNVSTFGVGYELAQLLERKKSVLVLVKKGFEKDSYAAALTHDLLTVKSYSMDTIAKIVENFISDNTITTKDLRFNFVMDRLIYNHLRNKSYRSGKTKAEIMRDLLLADIRRNERS